MSWFTSHILSGIHRYPCHPTQGNGVGGSGAPSGSPSNNGHYSNSPIGGCDGHYSTSGSGDGGPMVDMYGEGVKAPHSLSQKESED